MAFAIDQWVEGMIPGDWHCHYISMEELTYGHMVLMERMLCTKIKSPEDIAHCLMICSRKYKDALRYVNYWKHNDKLYNEFLETLHSIKKHPEEWIESWFEYFSSHTKSMQTMEKQKEDDSNVSSRQIGSPFLAVVRVSAIKLGYKPSELNETPFAHLMLDLQVNSELSGRIEIGGGSGVFSAIEQLKERAIREGK